MRTRNYARMRCARSLHEAVFQRNIKGKIRIRTLVEMHPKFVDGKERTANSVYTRVC